MLAELTERLVELAMAAELTEHLGYERGGAPPGGAGNVRNGSTAKTPHTDHGSVRIETPRDRNGSFEAQIVPKRRSRCRSRTSTRCCSSTAWSSRSGKAEPCSAGPATSHWRQPRGGPQRARDLVPGERGREVLAPDRRHHQGQPASSEWHAFWVYDRVRAHGLATACLL